MPTQRVYVMIVLCTVILFSCSNKKEKATTVSTITPVTDTVRSLPGKSIDIAGYNNAFAENSTQKFIALQGKETIIKAAKGLKLTVDPNALEKEDGSSIDGEISVSIIELTSSEDLFKNNAATISDGRLLVSGGSYFIGMECNGQKLKVKNGNSLKMEFPKIKANEMELFYGKRDVAGNMNWTRAGQPLTFDAQGSYTDYTLPYPDSVIYKPYNSKYHLYESLDSKVIFGGKEMSIKAMVDILQKRGVDKNIDSVNLSWNNAHIYNARVYNYNTGEYGYWYKRYRVISCKDLEAERDSLVKEEKIRAKYLAANAKYKEEWMRKNEENSLAGQLQKYYSPCAVKKLGWINCDRFYNDPQNTEVPVELPITFNNPVIEYFIIYKSFSGLINGRLGEAGKQQYVLTNLPAGQPVTLIAFTKDKGQLFECRQDFVIEKNKPVRLDFKNTSKEELNKLFGKNVRI
jgi:hypothetical protein